MGAAEQIFEKLDRGEVRRHLATKGYLGADAALERLNETEHLAIAREARDAAWFAARAADTANSKATIAVVIAIISVIIAVVLAIVPYLKL